jgi:hypothetical protein
MRARALVAILVGIASVLGCGVDHDVRVRVRDPREVALEVETTTGPTRLLPPGDAPVDVPLPPDTPAAAPGLVDGRRALRLENGAIELRCAGCAEYPEMEAVDASGTIALAHADDAIRWASDGVHVRFVHWRISRGRRARRVRARAFEVTLVTPASNVVEISDHRTASRHNALSEIGLGVVFLVVGTVELGVGLGARLPLTARAALSGSSLGWSGLGSAALTSGIQGLRSVDTTLRLYPR